MKSMLQFSVMDIKRTGSEIHLLTHLRADAVSEVASFDMTSISALVVSENLDMSTGTGTLGRQTNKTSEKHF